MKNKNEIIRLFKNFSVANPYDPIQTHVFENGEDLASLLFDLVTLDINEPTLGGLPQKILHSLEILAKKSFEVEDATKKIEALATGFESFLKKVAILKYEGDIVKLYGDSKQYLGILETSLGKLLEGEVGQFRGSKAPRLYAPIVSFTYAKNNVRVGVYEKARQIRNEVHKSPLRSIWEALELFKILSAAYLFVIEENLELIKQKVDKLYIYATRTKETFAKLELRYVELDTINRTYAIEEIPELSVFEWQDELDSDPYAFNPNDPKLPQDVSLNETVTELVSDQSRLWLIGEPGAGKTTSLKKIACEACIKLLSGVGNMPCPVFLMAPQIDKNGSLVNAIFKELEVCESEVERYLEEGKLLLLIDGINEISEDYQEQVLSQIKNILEEYPRVSCVLSSRKYAFRKLFDIPVYELMPLTDDQILEYFKKNLGVESKAIELYNDLLSSNGKMIDFARNPLMLCMITRVASKGALPSNRGMLFRTFARWILSREKTYSQFSVETKEYILASIAFLFRNNDSVFLDKTVVFEHIKKTFSQMSVECDVFRFYQELLKNGLLSVDNSDRAQFFHELFLEYYTAEYLLKLYSNSEFYVGSYALKSKWQQPLIILAGLIPDSNRLIQELLEKDLILAARCVASGAIIEQVTMNFLLSTSEKLLSGEISKRKQACIVLLELGTNDSLRLLVKYSKMIDEVFDWALKGTERPELASLKLLRFGQTGLKRIKSCMRVLSKSANSKIMRDTEDVAKAQIEILKSSPDGSDIFNIARIGISHRCLSEAASLVMKILEHERVDTNKWRACMVLAIDSNLGGKDIICERINKIDNASGELEFSILLTCVKNRTEETLVIASRRVSRCFDAGLYLLAKKYIELFDLKTNFPFSVSEKYISDCAREGKIGVIAAWTQLYPKEDIQPYLKTAMEVQIQKGNFPVIVQYGDLVRGSLDAFADIIKQSILSSSYDSYKRKIKFIRKIVNLLESKDIFNNMGIITVCNTPKRWAFVAHLARPQNYFFHFSAIEQKGITPVLGQFVTFSFNQIVATSKRNPKIRRLKVLG